MEESSVRIVELPGPLGAEVRGIDLREPVPDALAHELRSAYADRLLVLFRNQDLSAAEQERAVGIFGPVLDEFGDGKTHSFVSNISDSGLGGTADQELIFHSDMTNTGSPASGLSLYALEMTEGAANTRFANAQRGYRVLPPSLRQQAEDLTVIDGAKDPEQYDRSPELLLADTHSAVITHPRNGKPQLYCNLMWTHRVVGMEDSAAREVLDSLFQHLYDASNIYEHRWEVGDLVVWDNIAVQHSRGPIPEGCRRRFRRVAIGTSTPQFVSAMRAVRDRSLVFSKKTT